MIKKIVVYVIFGVMCWALEYQVKSLSADFVQLSKEGKNEAKVYYEGSFVALAPFYARWEYKKPVPKVIYFKNNELISYEPMLSQVVYTKLNSLVNFLQIIQKCKPKEENPNLCYVQFEGRDYRLFMQNDLPVRLEYEDALGHLVILKLKNVVLNPKVSQEFFTFIVPHGVDVIKE